MLLLRLHKSVLVCLSIVYSNLVFAQEHDPIVRKWMVDDKSAKIEIYKGEDDKYYGKVVWLRKPTVDGKQKIDIHNPVECKRNRPLMGMVVLTGFIKTDDGLYEKGAIYDPKTGNTYNCKMILEGDSLFVRGFVGISIIGKSTVWTKAAD